MLYTKGEGIKELYNSKSSNAFKISLNLQNASYLENIVKMTMIDFNESKFFETKNDSNGHLFAFKNQVLERLKIVILHLYRRRFKNHY